MVRDQRWWIQCVPPQIRTQIFSVTSHTHTRVFLGTYCCSALYCWCWLYFIMSYRRSKIYLREESDTPSWFLTFLRSFALWEVPGPQCSVGLMLWHATHLSSPLRHLPVLIFRIQEVLAWIIPASLFSLADIFYKTNTHLSGFGEFELCFLLTLW